MKNRADDDYTAFDELAVSKDSNELSDVINLLLTHSFIGFRPLLDSLFVTTDSL